MEKEQTKKIEFLSFLNNKSKLEKCFYVAMIVILAIIAIILVDIIRKKSNKAANQSLNTAYDVKNINVHPNEDESIDKFIRDYFKARSNLNYPKIFSSYGRDYYKEERESKDDSFKKIVDNIRYEKIFVSSYDDINIYTEKGFYENEIICIVTYDMAFGFTTDKAPMIIVFYLVKNDDSYIIKDNFDVGTSKYIVDVVGTDFVKELYNDVYARLNRVLLSNEDLKLVYNSFRQSEMNMKSDLGPLHKKDIIEKIISNELDPIKNANEIYDEIANEKKENSRYDSLNKYLDRVIASLSDAQRMP
ncbi:MAG: hypothetical protein IJP71_01900 [Lachnospiraceae bacterium]|nr:hypothetical protein [Lachnospiraceae bacterium]